MTPAPPADPHSFTPASVVLQRLHDEAPADHFTLGWLMGRLGKHSFGIIMLLLALVALAPGIAIVAGLLLMIPAFQMVAGHAAPFFPRRIAAHPFPTRHLAAVVQRAVPILRYLEKMVHPRWPTPLDPTKRLVGVMVVILDVTVVGAPPMGSVVPAGVIVLIALAYLEDDGLLLAIALLAAAVVLAIAVAAVWETVRGAEWISRLW